jgi:hypothetical protein
MVAHEVLAGEHRMFLDPDDGLREVQPALGQRRRIVGAVGVAAPEVESAARLECLGQIADGVPSSVGSCQRRFMMILRHRLPGGWLRLLKNRLESPQIAIAHDLAKGLLDF